jgi:uncharacterized protein YjbI with pentapeptide repeats
MPALAVVLGGCALFPKQQTTADGPCAQRGESHSGHRMDDPVFANRELRCAVFDRAELTSPDFTGADLSAASFRDVSLAEADFRGAILADATFTGATLTRPSFVGADLRGADFGLATITAPDWTDATCPDGTSAAGATATCDGHLDPRPLAGQP